MSRVHDSLLWGSHVSPVNVQGLKNRKNDSDNHNASKNIVLAIICNHHSRNTTENDDQDSSNYEPLPISC